MVSATLISSTEADYTTPLTRSPILTNAVLQDGKRQIWVKTSALRRFWPGSWFNWLLSYCTLQMLKDDLKFFQDKKSI